MATLVLPLPGHFRWICTYIRYTCVLLYLYYWPLLTHVNWMYSVFCIGIHACFACTWELACIWRASRVTPSLLWVPSLAWTLSLAWSPSFGMHTTQCFPTTCQGLKKICSLTLNSWWVRWTVWFRSINKTLKPLLDRWHCTFPPSLDLGAEKISPTSAAQIYQEMGAKSGFFNLHLWYASLPLWLWCCDVLL